MEVVWFGRAYVVVIMLLESVESWDVVTQLCMSSVGLVGEKGLANG